MKKKRSTLKKILIGAGICVGGLVIYRIGYNAGDRDISRAISRGIDEIWKATPELEDVMWKGLEKVENQRSRP